MLDLKNSEIQKEIKNSYKLQDHLMKSIDKEIKTDEEILRASNDISELLLKSSTVRTIIDKRDFQIRMAINPQPVKKMHIKTKEVITVNEDFITLFIVDVKTFELSAGKYQPYTSSCKVDKRYSLKDNIKVAIEGFIRHITGNIKPEIIE